MILVELNQTIIRTDVELRKYISSKLGTDYEWGFTEYQEIKATDIDEVCNILDYHLGYNGDYHYSVAELDNGFLITQLEAFSDEE